MCEISFEYDQVRRRRRLSYRIDIAVANVCGTKYFGERLEIIERFILRKEVAGSCDFESSSERCSLRPLPSTPTLHDWTYVGPLTTS